MSAVRITNPNTGKTAIVYIDLTSIVPTNEYGDNKYVFLLSTSEKDCNGNSIPTMAVYNTSVNGFLDALPQALAVLSSKICWGQEAEDRFHPYVSFYGPTGSGVSLFSSVVIGLEDPFPSVGIDPTSIKMFVNDIDVSNDINIDGELNKLTISWSPRRRVVDG